MELLKFTVEFAGFEARILRLNHQKIGNSIKDIIYGVSPDYAVIGFKNEKMINEQLLEKGISLDLALFAFEERIKNLEGRMLNMELKMENENLKTENEKLKIIIDNLKTENNNLKNENSNLKTHIDHLNNENIRLKQEIEHLNKLYNEIINSKSWKITKPLRKITNFLRKKKRYTVLSINTAEEKDLTLSKRAKEIYEALKKELKDTNDIN
jgi:chromosome segregation ATPase